MERLVITPRPEWQAKVESEGLVWHTVEDKPYWNEAAYYSFTAAQVDELEKATDELYEMFLTAGQYVLDNNLLGKLGIPESAQPFIYRAWEEEPAALNYGRFDLGYDGKGPPKLFEFNCDTPTSLVEAAVIQWSWKEEVFPSRDQFNSLHDKLVAKFKDIAPYIAKYGQTLYFAHVNDEAGEDTMTVTYMRELARLAGIDSSPIFMEDIGWDGRDFLDLNNNPMRAIYKLYPWEWLVNEMPHLFQAYDSTLWLEPVWKMMWSNKGILPILNQLYPNSPYLLPTSFEPPASGAYVKKPLLAREGANITIVSGDGDVVTESEGDYGYEGYVYQSLYDLPNFDGNRPVIGSWIVDGWPAGMGIREGGLITGNTARFVPHVFR